MTDLQIEAVAKAMRRAYSLGQTYWQQADSESYSQNRLADATQAKFDALTLETCAALSAPAGFKLVPIEPTPEMVKAGWIDKDDVNPDEIWAAMLHAAPSPQEQT